MTEKEIAKLLKEKPFDAYKFDIEDLKIGYIAITGLDNFEDFTEAGLRDYMIEAMNDEA